MSRDLHREPAVTAALRLRTDAHAWAIDPRCLMALAELDGEFMVPLAEDAADARRGTPARAGSVATVPLKGVLMPAMGGLLGLLFGGGGLEDFKEGLTMALDDPEVDVIVMDVNSPGGVVDHIPETAAAVRAARARKPVVAVSNCQMDSAAYWIGSQADEISVTPSGEAGSIGVYQLHRDASGFYKQRGMAHTLVKAGKYKISANPYEPLSDVAREELQANVDDYYRMFTADVARGRRTTREEVVTGYGEGRALHARQAVSEGLADRVETLPDTIRRVKSTAGRAALERRREQGPSSEELLLPTPVERQEAWEAALAARHAKQDQVTYTSEERHRLLTVLG